MELQIVRSGDNEDEDSDYGEYVELGPQLQKVFLPPGTGFLRRNFPNIDDEFS